MSAQLGLAKRTEAARGKLARVAATARATASFAEQQLADRQPTR